MGERLIAVVPAVVGEAATKALVWSAIHAGLRAAAEAHVEVFIDLGDVAMAEPAGQLALPWKAVGDGTLLDVSRSDHMQFFATYFLYSPEAYVSINGRRILDGIDAGQQVLVASTLGASEGADVHEDG